MYIVRMFGKLKCCIAFVRLYSSRSQTLKYKYLKTCSNHMYKKLYPWKTREEFARHLVDPLAFCKDGLIAINKPYGIAIDPPREKDVVLETLGAAGEGHCEFSIKDVLPMIQAYLNLKTLSVIKSPERYTSGIMLLACNSSVEEKVAKALRRAKSQKILPFTYWAVTTCIPPELHSHQKVGIKLVEVKEYKQKVPVIETCLSETAIKRQIFKPATAAMTGVAVNNNLNTALLEVSTSTNVWHFLRVFLAYKLAPVLGDQLYAARVKMVLGKPVSVSPFNKASYELKSHPAKLCNQLQLAEKSCQSIPTHLHLKQFTLPGYNGEDLTISADPQQHFLWTLKQLQLLPETGALTESVQAS